MAKVLTKEEIQEIQEKSKNFPVIKDPYLLIGPKNHKTILGKSPINGLVMIYGNDETGFLHINERHGHKYEYTQWKNDNPIELDEPTSFPESEFLIIKWAEIVDKVFSEGELNLKNNKQKDDFDLYIGPYNHAGEKHDCFLLVYKNTKIIHTLFLNLKNKIYNVNKPKGFHFTKGKIECTADYEKGEEVAIIPYFDNKNEKKVQIVMRRCMLSYEEEWIIKFEKENQPFKVLCGKFRFPTRLSERISYYRLFGLKELEREIGKINKMSLAEIIKKCK